MDSESYDGLWAQVEEVLRNLAPSERRRAIRSLHDLVDRELVRMEIPSEEHVCAMCGFTSLVRCGRTAAGTQRYKCKSCGRVQSFAVTGSVFGLTKLPPETWHRFVECFSCPEVVGVLDVTVETAWYMRAPMLEVI